MDLPASGLKHVQIYRATASATDSPLTHTLLSATHRPQTVARVFLVARPFESVLCCAVVLDLIFLQVPPFLPSLALLPLSHVGWVWSIGVCPPFAFTLVHSILSLSIIIIIIVFVCVNMCILEEC